jgi:hypothetical protein
MAPATRAHGPGLSGAVDARLVGKQLRQRGLGLGDLLGLCSHPRRRSLSAAFEICVIHRVSS